MTENLTENTSQSEEEEDKGRVYVGFHPFGGIRLQAEDVRLSPQEAFILAGQLNAHATLVIQQEYVAQAQAARLATESDIIIPGR